MDSADKQPKAISQAFWLHHKIRRPFNLCGTQAPWYRDTFKQISLYFQAAKNFSWNHWNSVEAEHIMRANKTPKFLQIILL